MWACRRAASTRTVTGGASRVRVVGFGGRAGVAGAGGSIGAAVGVILTLAGGNAIGLAPAIYLFLLPIGFGAGAVLGALVNKRANPEAAHASLPPRTTTPFLVKVPPRVAAKAPTDASARDLIDWSQRGFVE